MPQLNIEALIKLVRNLTMELHSIYDSEKDFDLSDRILSIVFRMENILHSLETVQNQNKS